ncbi:phosphoribosylanthranilate isomerase [soil metagenome]
MRQPIAIKVCGMRDKENIESLSSLKPDYLGLIFYPGSKRYVGENYDAENILNLPSQIKKVGVFVNSSQEEILKKAGKYQLDFLQLHGDESAEFCKKLNQLGFKIIKAFSLSEEFDFEILKQYEPFVSYFLFDTKGENYGGNGVAFNWEILKKYQEKTPFFLSGGIDLHHVEEIKNLNLKRLHAIDLNSRFEIQPAFKDIEKLNLFKKRLFGNEYEVQSTKSEVKKSEDMGLKTKYKGR